jgi:hypothetical protein
MKPVMIRRSLSFLLGLLLLNAIAVGATVRDFGATGDGKTDDTDAIQRAVDAGGVVEFPAGIFRLTRTIRVELERVGPIALSGTSASSIEMAGEGPAFHFVGTVKRTAAPSHFPPEFWETQPGVTVNGLSIVGRNERAVGLQVTRTMQLTVSGCRFRQLLHGIHFTERNRNALIADCHVYDNRGAGIFVDQVDFHQLNINACHISYNHGGGIVVRGGSVRNVQIGSCDIEANVGPHASPTANILLDSTGGSIGEVEISGCTIQHYPGTPGFANIRFIGHSTAVPFTTERRHGNLVVTGNMINDADINIHLDGVRGAVLTGNSIHIAATHDVLIENSAEIVFSDTVLDRHPRYNPDRKTGRGPVQQGILIRNSESCTLSGLRINGGRATAAIEIQGGRYFHVNNCTVQGMEKSAIRLTDVQDSILSANLLIQNDPAHAALEVKGGGGNLLQGNLVRGRSVIDPASTKGADGAQ